MAAQAKSVAPIATTAIGDGGWQAQSIALTATTAIGDGGLQAKRVALKAGTAMLFCWRTIDNKVSNNSYSGVMAQGNLKNPLFSVIDNIGKNGLQLNIIFLTKNSWFFLVSAIRLCCLGVEKLQ